MRQLQKMCEFSSIYLQDLGNTKRHEKKQSVNRHRSFKEQVPKSAKTASNVQGHYFD